MERVRQVGRYRLIRPIAYGGMAEVFLAEVEQARQVVKSCIVKRILPTLADNKKFAAAFIDEARIGARLNHPNLVATLDFFEVDKSLYLALEKIDGPDLGKLCDELARSGQRMPIRVALTIIAGVLRGLSYAHQALDENKNPLNIVHRDVNPPNILLGLAGQVKLGDFGIARAASRQSVTRFGQLKGKIPYMSPEQAQGQPVDQRSDIYSTGVVLYELLTGGRLFAGADEMAVLKQVQEGVVGKPSRFRLEVDPQLDRICMKALAKNLEERYQTAAEFLAEVEQYRAKKYSAFGEEKLAAFINRVTFTNHDAVIPESKTAVLDQSPPNLDTPVTEALSSGKSKGQNNWRKAALGALLLLICGVFLFFLPAENKEQHSSSVVPALSGVVKIEGGAKGAFATVDGKLVGRAPIQVSTSAETLYHPTFVFMPGHLGINSNYGIKPGKTRFVDLGKKVKRARGWITFGDSAPDSINIDGQKMQVKSRELSLTAGWHRINWKDDQGEHVKYLYVGPKSTVPIL